MTQIDLNIRPILFNSMMVRGFLEGRKTQTRRVAKLTSGGHVKEQRGHRRWHPADPNATLACPYGQPGDRLRVKEAAWMWCERRPNGKTKTGRQKWLYVPMREAGIFYAADHSAKPIVGIVSPDTGNQWGWRLKIGRFLPSWASRILLEIVSVRIERLNSISEADARAEGVILHEGRGWFDKDPADGGKWHVSARDAFKTLWVTINGPDSWAANPLVWVIGFKHAENKA